MYLSCFDNNHWTVTSNLLSLLKRKCGWFFFFFFLAMKCAYIHTHSVPEIRIRVRKWEALGGKFGSVAKTHQSYKLWTTDCPPLRLVPSSGGGRVFKRPSAFWMVLGSHPHDRGSSHEEHSKSLILSQNIVTSKILKANAKLTLWLCCFKSQSTIASILWFLGSRMHREMESQLWGVTTHDS